MEGEEEEEKAEEWEEAERRRGGRKRRRRRRLRMRAEEGASGPRQEPLEELLDTAQPPLLRLLPILLLLWPVRELQPLRNMAQRCPQYGFRRRQTGQERPKTAKEAT